MKVGAAAVVVAFALAASAGAATSPRSGIFGHVTRGPLMPVCVAEEPCDGPAANVTLVFTRAARQVARARTTKSGDYRVRLVPGRYTVQLAKRQPVGGMAARSVRVMRGRFVRLDLAIDTGIR